MLESLKDNDTEKMKTEIGFKVNGSLFPNRNFYREPKEAVMKIRDPRRSSSEPKDRDPYKDYMEYPEMMFLLSSQREAENREKKAKEEKEKSEEKEQEAKPKRKTKIIKKLR